MNRLAMSRTNHCLPLTASRCIAAILVAGVLCLGSNPPDASAADVARFSITDCGADGKDAKKDTAAFQQAIDACTAAGGGVVDIPSGTYTVGRIVLKNNVTLNLHAGAVLQASTDRTDYPAIAESHDSNYQPTPDGNALNSRCAVLYAFGAKNVAVTGRGKLFGDGKAFWTVKNAGEYQSWNTALPQFRYTPNLFRPVMVMFEDCDGVTIRDIRIEDSPCYAGWFAGCKHVHASNIAIRNDLAGPNTDGLHFSSCRNVHLSDCDFVCGDDCIAIDPNHRGPSCNFTITGCAFNTTVNAFRIYSGLDPGLRADMPREQVSDISVSNCTVENASGVFNITADRGDIRRLAFSNFTINMDYRGAAFFFLAMADGRINNVALSNMAIRTDGAGVISGENGGKISNIALDGLRYEMFPRTKLFGNAMPEQFPWALAHFAPYNLYIRHADQVRLHNIHANWCEADLAELDKIPDSKSSWSFVDCYDVAGLDIVGVVCSPYGNDSPAIRLNQVNHALISGCRSQPGTKVFVEVAGRSEHISLINNDLSEADAACTAINGVSPTAIFESDNRTRSLK